MEAPVLRSSLLLVCSSLIFIAPVSARLESGVLPNGDFEQGPKPLNLQGTLITEGNTSLPHWIINGGNIQYIKAGPQADGKTFPVAQGQYAVRLGGNLSEITQMLQLRLAAIYSLTFSVFSTCNIPEEALFLAAGSQNTRIPLQTMYNSNGDVYAWGFIAKNNATKMTISRSGEINDSTCGPIVDAIAIKKLMRQNYPTPDNLVTNGGFEMGPFLTDVATNGILIPPGTVGSEIISSPLPGWGIEPTKPVKYIEGKNFHVPVGNGAVELVAGKESAISQNISTNPNAQYALTFTTGDAKDGCQGNMEVEASVDQQTFKVPFTSKGMGEPVLGNFKFTAATNVTEIRFTSSFIHKKADDNGTFCGPILDEVRVSPI